MDYKMLNVTLIVVDFIFVLIGAGFCAFMLLVWLDVLKQNDKINEEVKQDD